jgi:hypothetical protein
LDARTPQRRAFNDRPNTDDRAISTEYEYAEVCEWIYGETHDQRFIERLLQWTDSHQKVQPTQAWPYSMEYTYSGPGPRRVRALALAVYLDPKSPRIGKVTPREAKEARDWLKTNNPFVEHSPQNVETVVRSLGGNDWPRGLDSHAFFGSVPTIAVLMPQSRR